MFDTMKIAKKIKEARIARNLTQMNLADAMGVSYQAVSNWERGNSMPDISKLEDLCETLQIGVTELLGMENRETAVVEKLIQTEEIPLTAVELTEVAPILTPEEVKKQVRKQKLDLSALTGIAPFLDETDLEELVEEAGVESLREIVGLAPFLDEAYLEELAEEVEVESLREIVGLAPFLDEDVLDRLVRKAPSDDRKGILALAPFLEEETLDWLVKQCDFAFDRKFLEDLAPFLEEKTIDALAEEQIAKGDVESLTGLYPFMEEETLHKVVKALMSQGDLEGLKKATHFLEKRPGL